MLDPVLPQEIVDSIIDILHNEPETLKQCCLVSKSWVPRTWRYLFANVRFDSARTLESWSKTFPDPTTSPASYVSTLGIDCHLEDVADADWIRSFSRVVGLSLAGHRIISFAPFHGFSHNLKSLNVRFIESSCQDLFDFISSCPLLEDLTLATLEMSEDHDFGGLQTSPPFTGFLKLFIVDGIGVASRHLLSLPNGLHFRELEFLLVVEGDSRWIKDLVLKCSDTLECLDVRYWCGTADPIDLSKATKLKHLIFWLRAPGPGRVMAILETITPEHRDLRQVSIYVYFSRVQFDAAQYGLELDLLLVPFWESRKLQPKVMVIRWKNGRLFPEITARRIIDLAEEY